MNTDVIISCALTGSGDTVGKNPAIPVTPEEIADAAIESAKAGAAIAHIHVRDPKTGKPSRDNSLYHEVVKRIRASDVDIIINLTTGMGGDFVFDPATPNVGGPGTDMASARDRVRHIEELAPEICTLDCGTLNFGDAVFVQTASVLSEMAERIQSVGAKPEIECFELGHIRFAKELIKRGLIDAPPMFQLCLGIPWGAEATSQTLVAMHNHLPPDANWAAFAIGRLQMAFVAQSMVLGGHVRIGLEDNLWLDKGVYASNTALTACAKQIVELMGGRVLTPAEARDKLGLRKMT